MGFIRLMSQMYYDQDTYLLMKFRMPIIAVVRIVLPKNKDDAHVAVTLYADEPESEQNHLAK